MCFYVIEVVIRCISDYEFVGVNFVINFVKIIYNYCKCCLRKK